MKSSNLPEAEPAAATAPSTDLQPLQAKLEKTLESTVPRQNLPTVRRAVAAYVHQVEEYYSGPLPHPGHLEHFERTLTGAADRIFSLAERQQTHRHAWEMRELQSSILTERIGLFGGIGVAAGLIVGAVFCAYFGATSIGIGLVAASAVSMVPAIIKGRKWLLSREPTKKATPAVSPQRRKKGGR